MPSTTNFSWTTPADTDLVKDGALAIRTLGNGIDTSLVDLKGGATGEILTKASVTDLDYTWGAAPISGLVQPVVNGGMDIWQRGTSSLTTATGAGTGFTADRWQLWRSSYTAGATGSRQNTSDTTILPNVQYSCRVQRNSGNTSTANINFSQAFENLNSTPYIGKTVTLSFYAKAGANFSSSSNLLTALLNSGTGTDQTTTGVISGVVSVINSTVTLTTSFQRFALTATIPVTQSQLFVSFAYTPVGTAGANDWFEVTGVQLDVGTYTAANAPTFRRSGGTIQGELAACQRYYFRNTAGTAYGAFGVGQTSSTTAAAIAVNHPVVMRVAPTSIDFGNVQLSFPGGSGAVSALTLNQYNERMSTLAATSTGLTANLPVILRGDNNTAGYVGLNAEL